MSSKDGRARGSGTNQIRFLRKPFVGIPSYVQGATKMDFVVMVMYLYLDSHRTMDSSCRTHVAPSSNTTYLELPPSSSSGSITFSSASQCSARRSVVAATSWPLALASWTGSPLGSAATADRMDRSSSRFFRCLPLSLASALPLTFLAMGDWNMARACDERRSRLAGGGRLSDGWSCDGARSLGSIGGLSSLTLVYMTSDDGTDIMLLALLYWCCAASSSAANSGGGC